MPSKSIFRSVFPPTFAALLLLEDSLNDREFKKVLDGFIADLGDGRGHVLGISDTMPPGAKWERLV